MEYLGLCNEAVQAVTRVGFELKSHWGKVSEGKHSVKEHPTDYDVVTVYDVDAEDMLKALLLKVDPDIGFTGEEGGCHTECDRYWLADPIDGTDAFIRGLPFCTVQLSLIEGGEPVIGIIFDFVSHELISAVKGMGATCAGRTISVSSRNLQTGRMIIETDFREKPKNLELFREMRKLSTLYQCCASGWEFIQIATGRMEGKIFYEPWAAPLDIAAGALLVKEAGGVVTNIGRNDYDFQNTDVIASNRVVHRELTEGSSALLPVGL